MRRAGGRQRPRPERGDATRHERTPRGSAKMPAMRRILTLLLAGMAMAQPPASQPDRAAQLKAAQLMEARRAGSGLASIDVGRRREAT